MSGVPPQVVHVKRPDLGCCKWVPRKFRCGAPVFANRGYCAEHYAADVEARLQRLERRVNSPIILRLEELPDDE